jgi:threonine dehydrogenase-like Zn-dependent dehydrogenase
MKAIAVHPGTPNSMHIREVEPPKVTDIDGGRGVLVEVIRVGVDGTDKGDQPRRVRRGSPWARLPHHRARELRPVVEVGPDVPSTIRPGGLVVATCAGRATASTTASAFRT